jgi:hypothetical protein
MGMSPEKQILRIAKENGGVVTIQMVALESTLSLSESKEHLEALRHAGFCTLDIDEDGSEIYAFKGLVAKRPLLES